jgi:hypothetical protein
MQKSELCIVFEDLVQGPVVVRIYFAHSGRSKSRQRAALAASRMGIVFALFLLRPEWACADGVGDDLQNDQDSCEPCMPRSTPLPARGHTLCVCHPGYTSLGAAGGAAVVGFLEPSAAQCVRRSPGEDASSSAPSVPLQGRRHECQPCDVGKFKAASGNGSCRDCPTGTVYLPAACFDASCSDADVIAEIAALHVLSEHDLQSVSPIVRSWCSLLGSLVALGGAEAGGHGVRACRRAIAEYEDNAVFELAMNSPLVMQVLLQSCCICGGGLTDSPSQTPPDACEPFVVGQHSCVDDVQDAVRWGCCACGFGRQLAATACVAHYTSEVEQLLRFSSASANDQHHKHLYFKSANLYIPQINSLLAHMEQPMVTGHFSRFAFDVVPSAFFADSNAEALGALFRRHGSDKAGKHSSYIIYSHILQSLGLNSSLRVLEIGLGTKNPEMLSTMALERPNPMSPLLQPGGSLRAFRDFLPNSQIYGADYDREVLFEEPRIRTTFVDQMHYSSFLDLNASFGGARCVRVCVCVRERERERERESERKGALLGIFLHGGSRASHAHVCSHMHFYSHV